MADNPFPTDQPYGCLWFILWGVFVLSAGAFGGFAGGPLGLVFGLALGAAIGTMAWAVFGVSRSASAVAGGSSGDPAIFWMGVWVGVTLSGGAYGATEGGAIGLLFGLAFAAVAAIPALGTAAVVTWALWLWRVRWLAATAGGAAAAMLACKLLGEPLLLDKLTSAPYFGAGGAFLVAIVHAVTNRREQRFRPAAGPWQFTLRDLFIRVTVLVVVMSFWATAVKLANPR